MKIVIDIPEAIIESAKTDMWCGSPNTLDRKNVQEAIDMSIEALKERPHGEWIPCKDDNFCKCSECKQIVMSEERSNFCPNCGSDNRKKEGESK